MVPTGKIHDGGLGGAGSLRAARTDNRKEGSTVPGIASQASQALLTQQ